MHPYEFNVPKGTTPLRFAQAIAQALFLAAEPTGAKTFTKDEIWSRVKISGDFLEAEHSNENRAVRKTNVFLDRPFNRQLKVGFIIDGTKIIFGEDPSPEIMATQPWRASLRSPEAVIAAATRLL